MPAGAAQDVCLAVMLTAACAAVPLAGTALPRRSAAGASSGRGALLMLGYLLFDGFTSSWQVPSAPALVELEGVAVPRN